MNLENPSAIPPNNNLSLLAFLLKWKWQLIISVVLATVLSAFFSSPWFITPKYKSTAIFYPANTSSVSKALIEGRQTIEDPLQFGEEEQAEQLVQILQSDEIRDKIVSKYHLIQHYDLDPQAIDLDYRIQTKFNDNIKFRRTEFMSVEVSVLDKDPKMAADIANTISDLLDTIKNKIQHVQAEKAFSILSKAYEAKMQNVEKLNDTLNMLRGLGIFDYNVQVENTNKEYLQAFSTFNNEKAKLTVFEENRKVTADSTIVNTKARIKGAEKTLEALKEKLDILQKYGGKYNNILIQISISNENLAELKDKLDKAKIDVEENLPVKFMVNKARISQKKAYPIRWLIVAVSVLGTLITCILLLIGYENYLHLVQNKNSAKSE